MEQQYKIESGIEIPNSKRKKVYKNLVATMKSGDSIFVSHLNKAISLAGAIRKIGKRAVIRKMENGYRIWLLDK